MTPSFPTRRASDLLAPDFYDGDPNFETFVRQQWSTGYEFEQPLSDLWTLRLNGRVHRSTLAYDSVYANGLQADNHTLNRGTATPREGMTTYLLDHQLACHVPPRPVTHPLPGGFDYQRLRAPYSTGLATGHTLATPTPDS